MFLKMLFAMRVTHVMPRALLYLIHGKKKLSDTQCKSNINTVIEELVSLENIAS